MTVKKSTYRKRRSGAINSIPKWIRKWFAGEISSSFQAYTYPYRLHLDEYWKAWCEVNPDAEMPNGLQLMLGHKNFYSPTKNDSGRV